MPLNRHQQTDNQQLKTAAEYIADKLQARRAAPLTQGLGQPLPPQDATHNRSQSQSRHGTSIEHGGASKYALDATFDQGGLPSPQHLKMKVPDTMSPPESKFLSQVVRPQQTTTAKHGKSQPRQQTLPNPQHEQNWRRPETPNPFDDTGSIQSMFEESTIEESLTGNPTPRGAAKHPPQYSNAAMSNNEGEAAPYSTEQTIHNIVTLPPDFKDQIKDEPEYQKQKYAEHNPQGNGDASAPYHGSNSGGGGHKPKPTRISSLQQSPETPTRAKSVPPEMGKIHAPAPRRSVAFRNTPELFSGGLDSPDVSSAAMAREESPDVRSPRSSSAQPHALALQPQPRLQKMWIPSHLSQNHTIPSQVLPPGRFQRHDDPRERMTPRLHEGTAPESEAQDPYQHHVGRDWRHSDVGGPSEGASTFKNKRTLDDAELLDYDRSDLKKKSLAELQKEPFTRDPRDPAKRPATDNIGNDLTLVQILENMHKVIPELQRETFRNQTDEEWADTGKWFVSKFQADLKELMEVRLERRKIALTYEDKIRRAQRVVEFQHAAVAKELRALQSGGTVLLKDRKPVAGTRSNTPVKAKKRL